jgi:hypothetical protein
LTIFAIARKEWAKDLVDRFEDNATRLLSPLWAPLHSRHKIIHVNVCILEGTAMILTGDLMW